MKERTAIQKNLPKKYFQLKKNLLMRKVLKPITDTTLKNK